MKHQIKDEGLTLCLGVHDHQPVGNFDFVFEYACDNCYTRFIDILLNHETVKWTVHVSGPLLLWLIKNRPELLDKIRTLLERGQVELLGSGLSEPVLATIPPDDMAFQVEEMQQLAHQALGVVPRGIWLTERVWEPSLPALLAPLGIEYTFVDDHHFACAGFEKDSLGGYYMVEKHGRTLKVFPISSHLRYLIPFQPLDEVFADLEAYGKKPSLDGEPKILTCLDDGEKFGLWPDTAEWVYENGWLTGFLSGLKKRSGSIRTALPAEILHSKNPTGKAALPTCSYKEMTEWALPVAAVKRTEALKEKLPDQLDDALRGGFWDNFYTKYEESNRMHKRMLRTSRRLASLEKDSATSPKDDAHLTRARLALMMGQCNDAYWHGLFGGLYFPFLRAEVYKQLINADLAMDEIAPSHGTWTEDLDADGRREWMARTEDQMLVVKPDSGGCIYIWEDHQLKLNLSDVLTRREEAYHQKVAAAKTDDQNDDAPATIHDIERCKEEGLHERLIYDERPRMLGRTFVASTLPDAESLRRGIWEEVGDLSSKDFEIETPSKTKNHVGNTISLFADLAPNLDGRTFHKSYRVAPEGVSLETTTWLEGSDDSSSSGDHFFCLELNLTINALDEHRRIRFSDGQTIPVDGSETVDGEQTLIIEDDFRPCTLKVDCDTAARFCVYPIETVSASESGFERIFQGICATVIVPFSKLTNGGSLTATVTRK